MTQQDSFEKEFKILRELGPEVFTIRGAAILVEILPPEEIKTAGGLIVATPKDHIKGDSVTAHRVEVGRILMTGPGYWDEEEKTYVPLEWKIGALVSLPQYSLTRLSHFPGITRPTENRLAMIKEDQILMGYPTLGAYNTAKAALNP